MKAICRKTFTKKSFLVAGAIVGIYLLVLVAVFAVALARECNGTKSLDTGCYVYELPLASAIVDITNNNDINETDSTNIVIPPNIEENEGNLLRPPARTNFLFVGIDNNNLSDALMAGTFYRDSGEIRLLSIPRDMYTHIPEHRMEQMRADGLRPPSNLKINAVRAFGGRVHGMRYLQEQLSEMLGVHFHYYVEVELDAFRHIVDAIGGVTMHIPKKFYYTDPAQGLVINIPAGYQHLDGQMAEGVVRFRSFPTGDLMRNTTHMEFMTQLIQQILTRESIMNNPLALAKVIMNDVQTNAGIIDIPRYLPYFNNVNADSVKTFTMPGAPVYRNGVSWFIPDAALPEVISQVFYAN